MAMLGVAFVGVTAVAVFGMGTMGAPIARRLAATGYKVRAWNRTAGRTFDIEVASSPAEAAHGADIALVMVTDAAAVETVLFGPGGAAYALAPGAVVLQMSTIAPDEVRALAARLPTGVELIDAPVAGSAGAAASGSLRILVGGAESAVARVAPVLEVLGTVHWCGGLGDGAARKLVLNTALVTAVTALADALAVAAAVGIDQATALDALAGSALGTVVSRLGSSGSSFAIALAAKDARLALHELGDRAAPVLRAAADVLGSAPDRSADVSSLIREAP